MRRRGSSTPCLARACREAERAEDAVARVDQVVALEAEQLVEFRDEHPVDLAGQLRGAPLVHTFVPTDGRMHVLLPR